MKRLLFLLPLLIIQSLVSAQKQPLTYFLPAIDYNKNIPTPESFLGYQIGEWHLSHDQQYYYLKALAAASPRIQLVEYSRSYENRPLVYLIITSEKNQANLEEIKAQHQKISDPDQSDQVDLDQQPIVLYQGYNIHGNEPSGGNAATLVAYYLAAGESAEVEKLLDEVVILLDPCYNPDGFHRFSTWVNMHKNAQLTSDPQDREYSEIWPRGRTNHYWFDLNRDWLLVQHPESKGRIEAFHEWKPNILTDHHEMGTNSTFFFMPGVPERTNPVTPPANQELTGKIGEFHAKALDKIGSLYYSREGFDDFYLGKGSTYPDANGCIGILFEQGSSRGHLQASINGAISFPFTIRNQVATSLSTHKAAQSMRKEILEFQKGFYKTAVKEAQRDERSAFVFGEDYDPSRLRHFVDILRRHQIETYQLRRPITVGGTDFKPDNAYIVPLNQPQYRMVRGIFETMTSFQDSIFYDVSSWTLPLAFNLNFAAVKKNAYSRDLLGNSIVEAAPVPQAPKAASNAYAYLFEWDDYYAPKVLNKILKVGLRAKVSTKPFELEGKNYARGTILVPSQNQNKVGAAFEKAVQQAAKGTQVQMIPVGTGLTPAGIDLGSSSFRPLVLPKVLLITGNGTRSYDVGEVWHLLDQRYEMVVTMVDLDQLSRTDISKYNTIIMADGSYARVNPATTAKLETWLQKGGTLVALREAIRYLHRNQLVNIEFKTGKKDKDKDQARRAYEKIGADFGSRVIGGAIIEGSLDLTHPLCFGYRESDLPIFRRGLLTMKPSKNSYASPIIYKENPLLSGYIKAENIEQLSNAAGAIVCGKGSGRIVCLADNPNFRAFWYGTNKIFANAIFFGRIVDRRAVEAAPSGNGGRRSNY